MPNSNIKLSWSKDQKAIMYKLERSNDQEDWQLAANIPASSNSFTEQLPSGTYYYRLYAVYENGVSDYDYAQVTIQ